MSIIIINNKWRYFPSFLQNALQKRAILDEKSGASASLFATKTMHKTIYNSAHKMKHNLRNKIECKMKRKSGGFNNAKLWEENQ